MIKFRIISWNFGKQHNDKLECIFENTQGGVSEETIFVIGLQEVENTEIPYIKSYFNGQFLADHYTTIMIQKGSGTVIGSGFDLLTFIIYPKNITIADSRGESITVPSEDSLKGRLSSTKGYLWTTLTINGKDVTLVNIHLPFQDAAFSIKNFEMLNEKFSEKQNVIIFGDYNSRSTVDDTCISADTCKSVKYKKNAEGTLSKLQETLISCATTPATCDAITDKLKTNDLLLQQMVKDIMPGYKEAPITFPPSYKIDPETGEYALTGEKKQRLSGYADRILVKEGDLRIQNETYKMLDCKGNDHFPVMLDVTMPKIISLKFGSRYIHAAAAAGGKRNTRRKKRKSKKNKSRKNRRKSTRRIKKLHK